MKDEDLFAEVRKVLHQQVESCSPKELTQITWDTWSETWVFLSKKMGKGPIMPVSQLCCLQLCGDWVWYLLFFGWINNAWFRSTIAPIHPSFGANKKMSRKQQRRCGRDPALNPSMFVFPKRTTSCEMNLFLVNVLVTLWFGLGNPLQGTSISGFAFLVSLFDWKKNKKYSRCRELIPHFMGIYAQLAATE